MTRPTLIYLSGPMTGLPEFNKPAFHRMTYRLRCAGYKVANPADWDHPNDHGRPWEHFLRRDLAGMLHLGCDAVAVLDGWHHSRGATLECEVARVLGWPVFHVDDLLAHRLQARMCSTAIQAAYTLKHPPQQAA